MTVTKAAKPHFVTIFERVKVKSEQNFSKNFYLRYLALCDPARREHGSQKWQKLHFSLCKLEAPCPPSWGQVWFCGYHPYVLVRGRKNFYVKKRFLVAQKPGKVDLFSPNPLTFREIAPFSFFFFCDTRFFFGFFSFFLHFSELCHHSLPKRVTTAIFDAILRKIARWKATTVILNWVQSYSTLRFHRKL